MWQKIIRQIRKLFKPIGQIVTIEREWLTDLLQIRTFGNVLGHVYKSGRAAPQRLGRWLRSGRKEAHLTKQAPRGSYLSALLRLSPIIPVGLLVVAIVSLISQQLTLHPTPIFTSAPQQRLLLVHHTEDIFGERVYGNAQQAFRYARLPVDSLDLAEPVWPDLYQYSAILFSTELLASIDAAQAERLNSYVADGGGVAVLYRGWNPHLVELFGFEPQPEPPPFLTTDQGGLHIQADLFPGIKDLQLEAEIIPTHTPLAASPRPKVEVIATTSSGQPLAWRYRRELGRVLYWNTALLAEKDARGLIVQSVANVQPIAILPLANVAVLQIDDFPAAFADEVREPIAAEYGGLSSVQFYSQVWFPDMAGLARRYGLSYTFLLPFAYNEQTVPPFPFTEWTQATIQINRQAIPYGRYAAQLAAQKNELGLHGYNHLPLTVAEWGSPENMAQALQATMGQWQADNLGRLPTTYAPPLNRYDEVGAKTLTKAVASLKVISPLYNSGNFAEGGSREFGPEPWNEQLFVLPRATSGYTLTGSQQLAMLSELGTMGVWTHFLHPDDVYDTPDNQPGQTTYRNPETQPWRGDTLNQQDGLYYNWRRWLDFVQTHYPWLRSVQTAEAADILQQHLLNQVNVELRSYAITFQSDTPTFFQVRINDGRRLDLNTFEGVQFIHTHRGEGYTIYTLRSVTEVVDLQLLIPEVGEE